jgi:hypothetical protein
MQREALRYMQNAGETLSKSPIENNQYLDDKYVKSACGIAYLGVLKAIEDHLSKKGLSKKDTTSSISRGITEAICTIPLPLKAHSKTPWTSSES